MKAYTDLNQSKKLADILPIESADMFYRDNGIDVKLMWEHNAQKVENPCWSLAALLSVLPRYIEIEGRISFFNLYKTKNLGWVVEYSNDTTDIVEFAFNSLQLVDACYELILKLNELNLL